ncbi:MAG: 7-cyano-7-deazaguanine synthase, partial [Muribaculaceae bacterium]|nr:7-cyano-7-deazaguanine synthase [Muribaculaceae bacterium]
MKDAVIIISGGMDSTTMLYEYQHEIAMAITFDYGSTQNGRERQ